MTTIFLDRDGVINVNRPEHVRCWEDVELIPGALKALALLTAAGHRLMIVTNQAIVHRRVISQDALDAIHRRLLDLIERHGGRIEAVLVCPHRPDEGCSCRKPQPGLLHRAEVEFGVNLRDAVMIGDYYTDLEAAHRAGCLSMLVLSGRVTRWTSHHVPGGCVAVGPDLLAVTQHFLMAGLPDRLVRPPWSAPHVTLPAPKPSDSALVGGAR